MKEYIEKLLKEQREICAYNCRTLSAYQVELVLNAPSPVIDLEGVTKEGSLEAKLNYFIGDCLNERDPSKRAIVEGIMFLISQQVSGRQAGVSKPVWVKASEKPIPIPENRTFHHIKYKGVPDMLEYYHGSWYWYDTSKDKRTPSMLVQPDSWSAIEWLDETAQQAPVEEETFKVTLPEPLHDSDTWRFPPKLLQELVDINDTLNEEESFSMEQAESVLLALYTLNHQP